MSTKTENYQLHQWAAEDQFLRTDFNEDHGKIDAAIKGAYDRAGTVESSLTNAINQKASAAALTALQTTVNGKADKSTVTALQNTVNNKADKAAVTTLQTQMPVKLELGAWGTYSGDNKVPRSFQVGFKPKLVFIETNDGMTWTNSNCYGGFFSEELPLVHNGTPVTEITSTGFTVTYKYLNDYSGSARTYYYFCFK